jgi:hypothetical protein
MKPILKSAFPLLLLAVALPLQGQMRTLELGFDGGIVYTDPSEAAIANTWDVSFPFQKVRAGLFLTPQISIESAASVNRLDFGDDETATSFGLQGNVLYHFTADRARPQFFAQAGGGMEYVSFKFDDESENDTQWLAGAGVGVKVPLTDWLSLRTAGVYWRTFESDFVAYDTNQFRAQVGLSVFTR